ncbi:DUF1957 domain-containing protein [candidate division KSB1 bacterium]|nr:DUF1957 domain-containing protein [candidate division KSB1 bacterium]
MKKPYGYFSFVLHSHLPYVLAHGGWPHGTDWLFEAAAETYLPLLNLLFDLKETGIAPKLTLGITPVLAEQLADDRFKGGLADYLEMKIKSAQENKKEFESVGQPHRAALAGMWKDHFEGLRSSFNDRYHRDLVGAFRELQDDGTIGIITSAATHGYLPLLETDQSVQAQIKCGVASYEKHFGRRPQGIWLPECAYRPSYQWASPLGGEKPYLRKGIEEVLADEGILYFIVDSHLLKGGRAIGAYLDRFEALKVLWQRFAESYQPREEDKEKFSCSVYLAGSEGSPKTTAFFARDEKTGLQVWSGEWGYPGDGWYLDFHKKHFPGGHRYWRVTSAKADLADKHEYDPAKVDEILGNQVHHFVELVKETLKSHFERTGEAGVICAPYDTELFGHWWFEGPRWIAGVLKRIAQDPEIELTTLGEHLGRAQPRGVVSLSEGSWGEGGFHYIWFNDWNRWTWRHIYDAEKRMIGLVKSSPRTADGKLYRILKQLARELLLLESSDWQFLISTWSARDYAEGRVVLHTENFNRLAEMAEKFLGGKEIGDGDWAFLDTLERNDCLFPNVDPSWWL